MAQDEILELETCKGCQKSVVLTKEEIDQIFGTTVKVKGVKLVTEDVYEERLRICKECEAFIYGSTCRHCGCVIQVKAKLAGAKCPYPFAARW